MKVKFLKRLRRARTIYWNPKKEEFVVLNHKKEDVKYYTTTEEFMVDIVYKFLGIESSIRYSEKILKRKRREQYLKAVNDMNQLKNE